MIVEFLVGLALSAASGPVVFGDSNRWYVLSREGRVLEDFTEIAGQRASDVAVSPDRKTRAFVPLIEPELRLWRADWPEVIRIPTDGDVAANPTFSDDGKWVYFVQNSLKKHGDEFPMRYSQIWRVRATGGSATQLTRARGCHQLPSINSSAVVTFTHATCKGGRGIGLLDLSRGTERLLVNQESENGSAILSADGARLAFTRSDPKGTSLHWFDVATGVEQRVDDLKIGAFRPRLAWSTDSNSVLYQASGKVWKLTASGQHTLVFTYIGSGQ